MFADTLKIREMVLINSISRYLSERIGHARSLISVRFDKLDSLVIAMHLID